MIWCMKHLSEKKEKIAQIIYDNMFERTWRNVYETIKEIEEEFENSCSEECFKERAGK